MCKAGGCASKHTTAAWLALFADDILPFQATRHWGFLNISGSPKQGQALKSCPLFLASKYHIKLLTARVVRTTQGSSKALVFLWRTQTSRTNRSLKATRAPKSTAYLLDNRGFVLESHLYLVLGTGVEGGRDGG